jgi:UDP-N-acetylmuramoyl-tripeptide--D-alanyl-D-alanine ligase
LGDMFELGKDSLNEHQAIIDLATSLNFDKKLFVGENFNLGKTNELQFKSYQDLEEYLKKNPLENQSILIKGSRGMRLERILNVIP